MIVLEASAALEMLLQTATGAALTDRLLGSDAILHAPHLIDLEVAQVVRRCVARGECSARRGGEALADLADLPLERHPHDFLLPRIWELRDNLTAHDAAYVALSELLEAPLLTRDGRLAAAAGHAAVVELC